MQLAITLGSQVEFFGGYRDLISLTSSWIIKGLTFSHVFVEHYGVAAWTVLHSSSCFHKLCCAIAGGVWVHLQGQFCAAACIA